MKAKTEATSDYKQEPDSDSLKKLADYFSWRQPYRGDEARAFNDARWALRQAKKDPLELAVMILELTNEKNALLKRIQAISVISTNQDFIHDATRESVEWAFGQKLKTPPKKKEKPAK